MGSLFMNISGIPLSLKTVHAMGQFIYDYFWNTVVTENRSCQTIFSLPSRSRNGESEFLFLLVHVDVVLTHFRGISQQIEPQLKIPPCVVFVTC
jgi:hypothetical protein